MRTKHAVIAVVSAALVATCFLLGVGEFPASECTVLSEWWNSRHAAMLYHNSTLQTPALGSPSFTQLGSVTYNALREVHWKSGTQFSKFDDVEVEEVLNSPFRYTGALLYIVPGHIAPSRRGTRPFLSVLPSAINLTAAIPLASINSAASAWERLQGRKLFAFTVESAPLPSCRSGDGPCAVWEVSTGRIVLDQSLVKRIGGLRDMHSFLGRFWTEVFNKVQDAAAAMTRGQATLADLSNFFAAAGPIALSLLMVGGGSLPLWFCIACPTILGLLAPFVFNFGLTAAAEQVCRHFQLPDEECTDLWWGAFALALMLSLASAIPIVYVCRLPECGKHWARP